MRAIYAGLIIALLASVAGPSAPATAQGFVGSLVATPDRGPVGTRVTLTGKGLPANAALDVMWQTVEAEWIQEPPLFKGVAARETQHRIATVTTAADGSFVETLKIPEEYGGLHDIYLMHGSRVLNKAGFRTLPVVTMLPASGPVGTPIRITLKGFNPVHQLETWFFVLYDNKLVGYMTALRTNGTARVIIPATGEPGLHVVEVFNGGVGGPYRNPESSPLRSIQGLEPIFRFTFRITEGQAVIPPDIEAQWAKPVRGVEPALASPVIWSDVRSGPVGTPTVLRGKGFAAGERIDLLFYNMKGNRLSATGFAAYVEELATVTAGADGTFAWTYKIPDHLGGDHRIAARVKGQEVAATSLVIDRTALPLAKREYRVGEEIVIHLKAVGWTETDNIVSLVYDNSWIGYSCGFNTDGDVVMRVRASGAPGWHYIDVYPALYRYRNYSQTMELPFLFRYPMLSWRDHPQPFVFRYAFKIVK
ncbi:MAG TPA: hypothetical protein VFJ45_12480 [bacterium]|nr:hypothetical protein [bacterium]